MTAENSSFLSVVQQGSNGEAIKHIVAAMASLNGKKKYVSGNTGLGRFDH